ncbi:type 2 lanthipeptide synthetase LanM family protein [Paenibacillus sp. TC-CSREp1]|uniref:type 2 lanthipeptide synthetase LanM family protein n=1 Tax=Paenibacillus sp. TC-CSREp1 TaxID=3410089 RepID=UPI003D060B76
MSIFNSTIAYNALYIQERKLCEPMESDADLSLVIPYWQQLLDFGNEQSFQSHIERHYQIDISFLRRHFSAGSPGFSKVTSLDSAASSWLECITHIFDNPLLQQEDETDYKRDMEGTDLSAFPFHRFYEIFVRELYFDLFRDKSITAKTTISRLAKHNIIQYYLDLLYAVTHKTLMLEINYLRMEGKLEGESPEQRYLAYVKDFLGDKNYLQSLVEEYPVMFRLIAEKTRNLKQFVREIIAHLEQDRSELQQQFGLRETEITRFMLGSGDAHKQGKTVVILEFGCGTKLVYKPRPMGIDETFQRFLHWMNEQVHDGKPLRTVGVLNKRQYGWMEFIPYQACISNEERKRFYYRLGKLLSVLHTMNATDFHYENIIANLDQPVLIDLESLFHHTMSKDHDYTKSGAINRALTLIRDSVLSTGVVPTNINREQTFDISGIGGIGEQQSPFQIQTVEGQNTDEIRLVKQFGKLNSGNNTPLSTNDRNGEDEIMNYLDDLSDGFRSGYNVFLSQKEETARQLEAFKDCDIRKILKSTMIYGKLLHLSYHPDFLRNQLDREFLLNRIALSADHLDQQIIRAEIADLLEGDIPYFSATPCGTWIRDSRSQMINGVFVEDGLTRSLQKLSQLSKSDLDQQIQIIKATVSAVYAKEDIKIVQLKNWKVSESEPINLLDKAKIIGDMLIREAIQYEGEQGLEFCWTSMVTKGGRKYFWQYSVTGPGIYDGNPGVALFFAQLWNLTREDVYRDACMATIRPIQMILEELIHPDQINLGAFLGLGGMAYGFAQLSSVLGDPAMKQSADRLLKEIPRLLPQDRLYDLIGGSAGALAVIASMLEQNQEDTWLIDIGEQIVKHLIQSAAPMEIGVAWKPGNSPESPYIGFSHGNAGIIFALCRFMPWSGQQAAIHKIVRDAIDYENRFYDETVENWFSEHLNHHSIAWCHGAPGILLSRIEAVRRQVDHGLLERDCQAALATTLDVSLGSNFSLCHGNLGNLDVLLLASKSLNAQQQSLIKAKQSSILDDLFHCSDVIHADINAIGVMNGLASIGYGLLRIAEPQHVPSLLTLELKGPKGAVSPSGDSSRLANAMRSK